MKIFVGKFDEIQVKKGEDKKAIKYSQKKTGLKYILSDLVKKKGKIIAINVYLTDVIN